MIDVGFEPVGAIATMQGGSYAYVDVSAQLTSADPTCIMLCAYRDTTIVSSAEERKCAYIVFG